MILTVTGMVCVVFGLLGLVGQLISTVNFRLAQRLGLQEADADTDELHRHLELNTARWDLFVHWVPPAAGVLMLLDHPWWPFVALVAGAVLVDTAGREIAKIRGLRAQGVRTGSDKEIRLYFSFMSMMFLIGVWCVVFGFVTLV
jgi:hypothetical protein